MSKRDEAGFLLKAQRAERACADAGRRLGEMIEAVAEHNVPLDRQALLQLAELSAQLRVLFLLLRAFRLELGDGVHQVGDREFHVRLLDLLRDLTHLLGGRPQALEALQHARLLIETGLAVFSACPSVELPEDLIVTAHQMLNAAIGIVQREAASAGRRNAPAGAEASEVGS